MTLTRHSAYLASGIEGLGNIPSHWRVQRLKHICEVFPSNVDKKTHEGEVPVRLCNYTDVYYRETITADLEFMQASATQEQIDRFTLRAGDTIITKDSETADDIAIAAYVPENLTGVVCGYHLAMVRPRSPNVVIGPFIKRFFDSRYARMAFEVRANGLTRVGLSQYELDNVDVPLPPIDEQRAIAAFLDHQTGKIDALVTEQERLIELLKEKRQAVITHAVTKGLNSSVPMTDSGVQSLGAVPSHWKVDRIKWFARMESGHTPDKKVPAYWDGDIPWVSLNDTGYLKNHEYIEETAHAITEAGIANSSAHLLPTGTVVFSRDATIGRCAILARPMACSQHFIGWVCGPELIPEYLLLRLRSMTPELDSMTTGATVKTIGMPEVRTLRTPIPPAEEQRAIVEAVKRETGRIDELMNAAAQAVELLHERRVALITAAVTGQIDVRPEVTKSAAGQAA